MKTRKLLLSAATMCAGLMGFVSQAQAAGFSVVVDCHGDGGLPSWSETGSTVTIKAYIGGFANTLWNGPVPNSRCTIEDGIVANFGAFSAAEVQKIVISISGNDAFWMDRVKLNNSDGSLHEGWGVDNNFGYCLSTDNSDGANSYCYDAKAPTSWTFL